MDRATSHSFLALLGLLLIAGAAVGALLRGFDPLALVLAVPLGVLGGWLCQRSYRHLQALDRAETQGAPRSRPRDLEKSAPKPRLPDRM